MRYNSRIYETERFHLRLHVGLARLLISIGVPHHRDYNVSRTHPRRDYITLFPSSGVAFLGFVRASLRCVLSSLRGINYLSRPNLFVRVASVARRGNHIFAPVFAFVAGLLAFFATASRFLTFL